MSLADELERLEKAATPAPWRSRWAYKKDPPGSLIAAFAPGHSVVTDAPGGTCPSQDMDFIAFARNHAPLLIAALRLAEAVEDAAGMEYMGDGERERWTINKSPLGEHWCLWNGEYLQASGEEHHIRLVHREIVRCHKMLAALEPVRAARRSSEGVK